MEASTEGLRRSQLISVLCEIEVDLNDRPLTSLLDSVHDPQPRTPFQLMLGYRLDSTHVAVLYPEENDDPTIFNAELLSRCQKNMPYFTSTFFK